MAIFGKNEPPVGSGRQKAAADTPEKTAATATPPIPSAGRSPPTAPASATGGAQSASFRYVDRPELAETFADSITGLFFDGQSLRIEFAVSRVDEIRPNTPITGRRYPACRIVLPPGAAVELINKMQQIGAALTKAGVVKQTEPTKT